MKLRYEKVCFVPTCGSSYRTTPEKSFFFIRDKLKKKWCNDHDMKYDPKIWYCCENHLNLPEDMENYVYWKLMKGKPILKPTAKLIIDGRTSSIRQDIAADGNCNSICTYHAGWGCEAIFPIIPDDVPMGVVAIYGFSPPLHFGRDHRLGFGFRFGNFADLQLMYEFGPQLRTKPLQPIKVRSASYRSGMTRRRPLVELLLRAGLLVDEGAELDQPR